MDLKQVFFLLCLLGMGYSQDLPRPLEFLAKVLNASVDEVNAIIEDFEFEDTSEKNIRFVLYLDKDKTQEVTSENVLDFINPDNPTKIIIHGWGYSAHTDWIVKAAGLYHQKGDYNVIAPDWTKDGDQGYLHSASVSRSIGDIIGQFLLGIAKTNSDFLGKVHVIGHSLGGQIAGFTGKKVASSGEKVDRITGLDAAAPLFEIPVMRPPSRRLDKTDASFVDLIHTNIGIKGVAHHYGTADFYINNGGPIQPGCGNLNPVKAIDCSHERAFLIYTATILDEKKYPAVHCANALLFNLGLCNENRKKFLGEGVDRDAEGPYFVKIVNNN